MPSPRLGRLVDRLALEQHGLAMPPIAPRSGVARPATARNSVVLPLPEAADAAPRICTAP